MLLYESPELLKQYRQGNTKAMAQIFEFYKPRIEQWLRHGFFFVTRGQRRRFTGLRSSSDRQDAMQDVFLAIFEEKAQAQYSGQTPFENYLFCITRNLVLRRTRHASRFIRLDSGWASRQWVPATQETDLATRRSRARVRQFVQEKLTERERAVALLRHDEGLTQAKTAALLGLTRRQVRWAELGIRKRLLLFFRKLRGTFELP